MKAILIGDDRNEMDRIRHALEGTNFDVSEAWTGEEVLTIAGENLLDLAVIVGSTELREMSGYELAGRLKTFYVTGPVVTIVVLGDPSDENVLKSFCVGPHATLSVPVKTEEFMAFIRRSLLYDPSAVSDNLGHGSGVQYSASDDEYCRELTTSPPTKRFRNGLIIVGAIGIVWAAAVTLLHRLS
jgi:DNA-binding response OmpR family regulator